MRNRVFYNLEAKDGREFYGALKLVNLNGNASIKESSSSGVYDVFCDNTPLTSNTDGSVYATTIFYEYSDENIFHLIDDRDKTGNVLVAVPQSHDSENLKAIMEIDIEGQTIKPLKVGWDLKIDKNNPFLYSKRCVEAEKFSDDIYSEIIDRFPFALYEKEGMLVVVCENGEYVFAIKQPGNNSRYKIEKGSAFEDLSSLDYVDMTPETVLTIMRILYLGTMADMSFSDTGNISMVLINGIDVAKCKSYCDEGIIYSIFSKSEDEKFSIYDTGLSMNSILSSSKCVFINKDLENIFMINNCIVNPKKMAFIANYMIQKKSMP